MKVGSICLDATLASIWPEAHFVHTKHIDGSGGAILGLAPWISKHIVASRSDPNNHCVWATVLIKNMLVGFCSIYAPHSSLERIIL